MRWTLGLGLILWVGCQNVVGPFDARQPQRVDDPLLPIPEQQKRGRDRLALPEDNPASAPRTFTDRPGPHGR
jgi:hypothetical protein